MLRILFQHFLIIPGNATINRINNISIDSIVFDENIQTIISSKKFKNDITIIGNITVDFINKVNLSTIYNKALTLDQPNVFNKNVVSKKKNKLFEFT